MPEYKRVFSFAVKKGEAELLEKLNQGLLIVKTNGEYERIYNKWLTVDDPWMRAKKYLLPATFTIVAIALIALLWLILLHQLVKKRTRELADKNDLLHQAQEELEARVRERTMALDRSNSSLQAEIKERRQTEAVFRETQAILQAALDNSHVGIAIADAPDGTLRYVNDAGLLIRGGSRQTVVNGIGIDEYVARWQLMDLDGRPMKPDEVPLARAILFGETGSREFVIRRSYDDDRIVLANAAPIRTDDGKVVAGIVVFMDITDRKKDEEKIKSSLREKETMLKEIHRRVKNNLQIISSLLSLQTRCLENERLEGILKECQDRIAAMAFVHAQLYKSKNFAEIDFGVYVRQTADHLFRSYRTSTAAISLVVRADQVRLPIDTAIPCGLILNELITNSLKYAFPEGRKGGITLAMDPIENGLRLVYEDDGIGFPKGMDFRSTEALGFGLKLVRMLVKQLNGSMEQFSSGGTRYVITLKPEAPPEVTYGEL